MDPLKYHVSYDYSSYPRASSTSLVLFGMLFIICLSVCPPTHPSVCLSAYLPAFYAMNKYKIHKAKEGAVTNHLFIRKLKTPSKC